ncbi:aminomethyl-transferring glycine dehydrogenase subunit GcvPA [bacterium]|nr:aminomethyl-transferring glycine dehydrogenase subunit GcvPA [bacterium]
MNYVPHTAGDRQKMLASIGKQEVSELFDSIPPGARLTRALNLPEQLSEYEVALHLEELASKNMVPSRLSFLGAGAYRHFVPAVVDTIIQRSEFMTAYTPYQPEVSQGTLQSIFEFQTMMCNLTGMDVCNASVYDGGCAAVDAVFMALSISGRHKVVVSEGLHPQTRELLRTYIDTHAGELIEAPLQDGRTVWPELNDEVACTLFQTPNFLGVIEDGAALCARTKEAGAIPVVSVGDPCSLAVLKRPGDFGGEIVVGDAQPIGLPLSYGGPYAGFVACKKQHMRRIPGRLCGMTVDSQGRRGFCLTLQAREQHIRRDKAFSNICTNQGLCALAVTVYLALLGPQGLKEVADASANLAHYFKKQVASLDGYKLVLNQPFFHEVLVECPGSAEALLKTLEGRGIVGGYLVEKDYPQYKNCLLFCFTEANGKAAVDELVNALQHAHRPLEGATRS